MDYKLLRLKEEIKAERLEKKIAKLGDKGEGGKKAAAAAQKALEKSRGKKKRARDEDDSSDDDDGGDDNNGGLLVVKQVHEWGDKSQPLPQVHLNEASKSRHEKKIRIDGSSTGANQKIVFNDDGDVEGDMIHEDAAKSTSTAALTSETNNPNALTSAREEYLQKVRDRLNKTKELDRKEARERIQEKHRKRKMKEKGGEDVNIDEEEDDEEGAVVTLGGNFGDDQKDDSESSIIDEEGGKDENANLYEDSDDSDTDSGGEDDAVDVKAQEELALAMLGK